MVEGWFVTGTDTGVGKTIAAAGLLRRLAASGRTARGMKPVASGCWRGPEGLRNDDALMLQAASAGAPDYSLINPYAFEPAIAPHLAAAEAGVALNLAVVQRNYRVLAENADVVVVEGAGGWYVPFDASRTMAEVAAQLKLGVILVVALRLGCINHALLTQDAIAARGLSFLGWIANYLEPEVGPQRAVIASLESRLEAPCLGRVPFLEEPAGAWRHLALPS